MTRSRIMLVAALVVALVLLLSLRTMMYTVDERELAVILEFGRPVASRTEPGLYFKMPLIQDVVRLPKTYRIWTTAGDPLVDLPTADGKKVEVNAWAVWRISDPQQFVEVLRTVDNAELRVAQYVRGAVRDTITAHDLSEVVRSTKRKMKFAFHVAELDLPGRDAPEDKALPHVAGIGGGRERDVNQPISLGRIKLVNAVRANVQQKIQESPTKGEAGGRGIELVNLGIADIDFVPQVRQTAFQTQITVMGIIAADNTSQGEKTKQEIINRTDAEVQKLEGEGMGQASQIKGDVDAEIIESYAKAIEETGEFYNFIRTLEAYQVALEGDTRLILTTDSEFLRLLKDGPTGGEPPATTAAKE